MKQKTFLPLALFAAGLLGTPTAHAADYFWDNNGATAGFGTAGGTWGADSFWGNSAGNPGPSIFNPGTGNTVNFGSATLGLGAGTVIVSGTQGAGNLTFGSASGEIVLSGGTINLSSTHIMTVDNSTDTISSVVSGASSSFTKKGTTGTLVLSGANTFTGNLIIDQGTVSVNSIGVYGADSAVGKAASGDLQIGKTNSGTLVYTGNGDTTNRTFFIGQDANSSSTAGGTIRNNGGGALIFTATNFNSNGGSGTAARTLNLRGSNANSNEIKGVIRNSGASSAIALTKSDVGKWILSGTNIYTGATNVNGGTLVISGSGSINDTSAINVAGGATLAYNSSTALTVAPTLNGSGSNRAILGGIGTINAAITLDNLGDVLAPGNSPGVQGFGTSQVWSSFTYDWELNDWNNTIAGTDIDQIQITGTLDLSALIANQYMLNILSLTDTNATGLVGAGGLNTFTDANRSWSILSTTSGITGFNASEWQIDPSGFLDVESGTWSLALGNGNNDLVLTYTSAVPEPSAALLGAIGLLALLRRRRA